MAAGCTCSYLLLLVLCSEISLSYQLSWHRKTKLFPTPGWRLFPTMERDSPESSPVKSLTSSPLHSPLSSPVHSPVTSPVQSIASSPYQPLVFQDVPQTPPSPASPDYHDKKRRKLNDQTHRASVDSQSGQHCRDLFNKETSDVIDTVNNQADENLGSLHEEEPATNEQQQDVCEKNTTESLDFHDILVTQEKDESELSSDGDLGLESSESSSDDSSESSEEEDTSICSSSASESEESKSEASSEDDFDESFSPKVHEHCDLTVDEGVLTLMNLFSKHKMSKVQMGGILEAVLKFIPKSSNLPKTQYALFNFVQKLSPISKVIEHFYCSKCLFYLGLEEITCRLCSGDPHKFYQIPLADQIRNLFEKHGLADAIDKYNEARQNTPCGDGYTDLLDGSEFKRARIDGSYNLTFLGHTDGISISESSDMSLWPVEWVAAEVPPHLRFKYVFISGIWVDECKPYLNTLMGPIVEELKQLHQHGVKWINPKTKEECVTFVSVPAFCVDAPVRAQLQNILQHGGRHCCHSCEQKMKKLPAEPVEPGKKKRKRKRVYAFEEKESTPRTADRMEAQGKKTRRELKKYGDKMNPEKGVKGPSVISDLPGCDRSTAVYPEYMHLLLCVVKQFMALWFVIKGPWSLSKHTDKINKLLLSIRVPDYITRVTRPIDKFSKWKANELRSFVLFYSVIIFSQCMDPIYFQHWLLFANAIYLLVQEHVSKNDVTRANIMLRMFCRDFEKLYPVSYCSYYMHCLLHLAASVEKYGPLHCNSAFMYENFNGILAKYIHGTKNQAKELVNNIMLALGIGVLRARCLSNSSSSTDKKIEFRNQIKGHKFSEKELNVFAQNKLKEPMKLYFRAKIKGEIFTCSLYSRQKRRNNFTIKYFDSAGNKVFGEIWYFCETAEKVAIVKKFSVHHANTFCHTASGVLIKHIIPILPSENYEVVDLCKIICKVVRVDNFVCLRPNKHEYNL